MDGAPIKLECFEELNEFKSEKTDKNILKIAIKQESLVANDQKEFAINSKLELAIESIKEEVIEYVDTDDTNYDWKCFENQVSGAVIKTEQIETYEKQGTVTECSTLPQSNSAEIELENVMNAVDECSTSIKGPTVNFKQKNYKSDLESKNEQSMTVKKRIKCTECSKTFSRKYNLTRHMLIHRDYFPYHCEICSRKFRIKANLDYHLLCHTGEKRIQCDICSQYFISELTLKRHIQVRHTKLGQKQKFPCSECSKVFNHKCSLLVHIRCHDVATRFTCDICSAYCRSKNGLNYHMACHHGKEFQCEHCTRSFTLKSSLQRHMKTRHSEHVPKRKRKRRKKEKM